MPLVTKQSLEGKTTRKLDMQTELPKKRYTLVCKKETFGISKNSKQPMVTREWEIIAPEKVTVDGAEILVSGVEMTQYLPLGGNANPAKGLTAEQATANAVDRFLKEQAKLGLDGESVDTDNPTLGAEGKTVEAICSGREYSPKEANGDPIYDPSTNKPIIRFQPNLDEILGLSSKQISQAF